jgi:hypothetical protein
MAGVSGGDFRRADYPVGQNRIGLLTGAGLLTLFASLATPSWPAKRGWLIDDPLLCMVPIRSFLPTPPLDPARSIRAQMIEITRPGSCMGCHQYLNSPGFALIGFDSFGRWRPEAGHGPRETEGWIPAAIMADEPHFDGLAALARLLAARPEAARCLTERWLRFALDRAAPLESALPAAGPRSAADAYAAFARSGFVLRELLLAIVRTPAFAAAP